MVDAARLHPQRTIVDERARLKAAIHKLRSLDGWANIPIVLIAEDGPPGAAEKLYDYVKDMEPLLCMAEAGSMEYGAHRFGVPKTSDSTLRLKDTLVEYIAGGQLYFSECLFSLQHVAKGDDVEANMSKLQHQFYAYRAGIKKKYDEYHNDDALTMLIQMLGWALEFIRAHTKGSRAEYSRFHRQWIR